MCLDNVLILEHHLKALSCPGLPEWKLTAKPNETLLAFLPPARVSAMLTPRPSVGPLTLKVALALLGGLTW